ncbi:MOSC domain-containing protein [Nannocystis exedens]|uniref:MOSC domain-containing protein n=1 Tax=Nannocystis exedens TaxID=54 RepID=A0A1I1VQG9_9BACT|nr:MOSC domain-containing protein [Nannocystis exedens]PCC72565.1 sulfurase [Nannocystis exedens]SFD82760.1 MOSC domain-containing protein [Nannocystis exedens]
MATAPDERGVVVGVHVNPAGGVPKHAVGLALVTTSGVAGDRQRDLKHHGGPDRAVCLFALERIEALAAEGHPIAPGTTGENLTIAGLDWDRVGVGDRLAVGDDVLLEITGPAPPCNTIAGSFTGGEFKRISAKLHPGWSRLYARVLREGVVRERAAVCLLGQDP